MIERAGEDRRLDRLRDDRIDLDQQRVEQRRVRQRFQIEQAKYLGLINRRQAILRVLVMKKNIGRAGALPALAVELLDSRQLEQTGL